MDCAARAGAEKIRGAMDWAELFPDEDYRFHMGVRRGDAAAFFRPGAENAALRAERTRWLRAAPQSYSGLRPEGTPLLEETLTLANEWASLPAGTAGELAATPDAGARCVRLGELWEPDFLLLQPDTSGEFLLAGGCVCFPSSWSLEEKLGRPLSVIHGPVPGLNASLGRSIGAFLARLGPGTAWQRWNWGLTRSPEWNQHPGRGLPRLDATVTPADVWLRLEEQALVALPRSRGVLFAIRIHHRPFREVQSSPDGAHRLARALQTMPEEVARYKGLAGARAQLIRLLA